MANDSNTEMVQQRQYFEHPRHYMTRIAGGEATQPDNVSNIADDSSKNTGKGGKKAKKALNPLLLLALIYTYTISGAFSVEESVEAGGALLTIIFIFLIPVVVSLPTAYVVSELTTAIPSDAGYQMWVNVTFHPVVYFAMVIMMLFLSFVQNALYPLLISEYLCKTFTCSTLTKKLLRLGLLLLPYTLNMIGIQTVDVTSISWGASTPFPVILMFSVHLFKSEFYLNWPVISYIPGDISWAQFLAVVSWNLCGLEQIGYVAEEIEAPQKTVMQALVPLMGLACVSYIPPILTGVSAHKGLPDFDLWKSGYWTVVAREIGGRLLEYITLVSSCLSAFGMTMSALCTTTEGIAGTALTGVFPRVVGRFLAQRNKRFGTHHWTLTINAIVTEIFCTLLDFGPLVKLDQVLYGIRVVMVFVSLLVIGYRYPHLHRPFKVPLGGFKLAVFLVPILFFGAVTVVTVVMDMQTLLMTSLVVGSSVVIAVVYCCFLRKDGFGGRIVSIDAVLEEWECPLVFEENSRLRIQQSICLRFILSLHASE